MDRLSKIAVRISRIRLANAYGFEKAREKMACRLTSIAFRVAFELEKLPTKDDDHVQETDVDSEFKTVPTDIRNKVKNILRQHDALKDWSSDQNWSAEAVGDPIKQFRSKKSSMLRELKSTADLVKRKYSDADLSPVDKMMGELENFKLKYEEEAKSYDDLPSSAITHWIGYTHNILSHLLYLAEQEEVKKGGSKTASMMEKMEFDPDWLEGFVRAGKNNARWLREMVEEVQEPITSMMS